MICARSTLTWRRQDGALWIDRHGVYSWMGLRLRDTLQTERERKREREREGGIAAILEWTLLSPFSNGFRDTKTHMYLGLNLDLQGHVTSHLSHDHSTHTMWFPTGGLLMLIRSSHLVWLPM